MAGSTGASAIGKALGNVGPYLKYIPLITVTLVGLFTQLRYLPNDDASWLLEVSRRLADGATLYSPDIVEINPPLIIQLTQVAYHAGTGLGIDPMLAWRLLVFGQICLSLGLCDRWLRRTLGTGAADLRFPLLALLAWLFACLPGYDYGQREHFIVLWLTPYAIAAAGRSTGAVASTTLRVVTGVLPALVLCVKPHYALSIFAVEATVVASRRSFRPLFDAGTASMAAFVILYGLSVVVLYPGFLALAIPLGLRYYPAYGVFRVQPAHVIYFAAAIVALVITREPRIAVVQARVFVAAAAGALAAFLVQWKGWTYHFLPAKTFLLLAVAVAICAWGRVVVTRLSARHGRNHRYVLAMLAAVCLTIAATVKTWSDFRQFEQGRQARNARALSDFVSRTTNGQPTSVVALSYSLTPAAPVVQMVHANWGLRFSCLWLLPGVAMEEERGQPPGDFGRPFLMGAINDDFHRWQPEFVLVDDGGRPPVLPQLLEDARFRVTWQAYRHVGDVYEFRIFRRVPSS